MIQPRRLVRALSLATFLLAACARAESAPPADSTRAADAAWTDSALTAYIAEQSDSGVAAWNRGDLAAYLAPFADSVVVVYPEGPETGRDRVEARQRRNQPWGGNPPTLQARIGRLAVTRLADDLAVQTVEVLLQPARLAPRAAWVTAVWRRHPDGWRIVHEQSF